MLTTTATSRLKYQGNLSLAPLGSLSTDLAVITVYAGKLLYNLSPYFILLVNSFIYSMLYNVSTSFCSHLNLFTYSELLVFSIFPILLLNVSKLRISFIFSFHHCLFNYCVYSCRPFISITIRPAEDVVIGMKGLQEWTPHLNGMTVKTEDKGNTKFWFNWNLPIGAWNMI